MQKSHFHFFPIFGSRSPLKPRGSISVGFLGSCQLSLFLGGVRPEGSIEPPPPHPETEPQPPLPPIFEHLRQFGIFVGLQIELSKSAFITKGAWTDQYVTVLKSFGVEVKQKVKYLGIVLGHVTSEKAYAPVITRAPLRAHFMSHFQPTQDEWVAPFQEWVLPLFVFPARAYFPTDTVVAKISVIYRVALRLNSRGLALPIMALPPNQGGYHLPPATHLPPVAARHTPLFYPAQSHREYQHCLDDILRHGRTTMG